MKILCGFETYYPPAVLLFLKQTLYVVKNAAKAFWKLLLGIMNEWVTHRTRWIHACIASGILQLV